jgi:hypothetical protein
VFAHSPAGAVTLVSMIRGSAMRRPVPRRADPPINFLVILGGRRLRGGSISPTAVNALAAAIQNQEGYYPGSLAYQNNNPGNLVYAGQPGATPGAGGFAAFSSYNAGYTALQNQIMLDATRGTDISGNPTTTVSQLLTSWAPPSQNDTATYIANVSASTGYDPNAPLSSLGTPGVVAPVVTMTSDDSSATAATTDLSSLTSDFDSTVDLSSVGLPSSVPVYALVGVGVLAAVLFSRH